MTSAEFVEKWKGDLVGYWATDASTVFWARSFRMPSDQLTEMSRDFMSTISDEHQASCCIRAARRALGMDTAMPGSRC